MFQEQNYIKDLQALVKQGEHQIDTWNNLLRAVRDHAFGDQEEVKNDCPGTPKDCHCCGKTLSEGDETLCIACEKLQSENTFEADDAF